jgi:hypothetical protein
VVRVSSDPLQSDLDIEIVTPLLESSDVRRGLRIGSLCCPTFQKTDHDIDSFARELHLLERHRFRPFLFLRVHYPEAIGERPIDPMLTAHCTRIQIAITGSQFGIIDGACDMLELAWN